MPPMSALHGLANIPAVRGLIELALDTVAGHGGAESSVSRRGRCTRRIIAAPAPAPAIARAARRLGRPVEPATFAPARDHQG
jgi:hypothetical protein